MFWLSSVYEMSIKESLTEAAQRPIRWKNTFSLKFWSLFGGEKSHRPGKDENQKKILQNPCLGEQDTFELYVYL